MSAPFEVLDAPIDDIYIVGDRRPVREEAVEHLAESVRSIGLQTPITIRQAEVTDPATGEVLEAYALIAGRHRLEVYKREGRDRIPAIVRDCTEDEAEQWEIAENLHRAELSALERDEQIARWIELQKKNTGPTDTAAAEVPDDDFETFFEAASEGMAAGEKPTSAAGLGVSAQVAPKPLGGRPESGVNAASRELGVERTDAQRAVKVASLSPEAKDAARAAGLDNNRTALLAASKQKTPEAQVKALQDRSKGGVAARYEQKPKPKSKTAPVLTPAERYERFCNVVEPLLGGIEPAIIIKGCPRKERAKLCSILSPLIDRFHEIMAGFE